jgi:hypothetical protein
MVRTTGSGGISKPENLLLHVEVLYRTKAGGWRVLSKSARSPYARPFHGGHDAIRNVGVFSGKEVTLLLWQSMMPIHGPYTVSGAYWRNR